MLSKILLFAVVFSAQSIRAHDNFCTWFEHKSSLYGHEYWNQSETGDIYTVSTCYAATTDSVFIWRCVNETAMRFQSYLNMSIPIQFYSQCDPEVDKEEHEQNDPFYPFYVRCAETITNCYKFTIGTWETMGVIDNTKFTTYLKEAHHPIECGSRTLLVDDNFYTWFEHKSSLYGHEYWNQSANGDIYTVNVYATEDPTFTWQITNNEDLNQTIPLAFDDCILKHESVEENCDENNPFYARCVETAVNSYNFTIATCKTLEDVNNTIFTILLNDVERENRTLLVDDSYTQLFSGERTSYTLVIIVGICMGGLLIFQSIVHAYLVYSTNQVKEKIKLVKKQRLEIAQKINHLGNINKKIRKRTTKKQQPNHYDANEIKCTVRTPATDDVIREMKKSKFYKKEKQENKNPGNDMKSEYDVVAESVEVIGNDDVIYDDVDEHDGIFGDDELLDIYGEDFDEKSENNSRPHSVYENWPQTQHDDAGQPPVTTF